MGRTIWHCPDCGADLDDGWCPGCQVSWSWAQLATDDPPDYQHPEEARSND